MLNQRVNYWSSFSSTYPGGAYYAYPLSYPTPNLRSLPALQMPNSGHTPQETPHKDVKPKLPGNILFFESRRMTNKNRKWEHNRVAQLFRVFLHQLSKCQRKLLCRYETEKNLQWKQTEALNHGILGKRGRSEHNLWAHQSWFIDHTVFLFCCRPSDWTRTNYPLFNVLSLHCRWIQIHHKYGTLLFYFFPLKLFL